jgi:hypothetical protein
MFGICTVSAPWDHQCEESCFARRSRGVGANLTQDPFFAQLCSKLSDPIEGGDIEPHREAPNTYGATLNAVTIGEAVLDHGEGRQCCRR